MHTRRCVLGGPSATQQTRLAQVYPMNYYRIYEIKTTPAGQYYILRKKYYIVHWNIWYICMYFQFNPAVVVVKRMLECCNENQYEIHYLHQSADYSRWYRSHQLGLSKGKISMNDWKSTFPKITGLTRKYSTVQ